MGRLQNEGEPISEGGKNSCARDAACKCVCSLPCAARLRASRPSSASRTVRAELAPILRLGRGESSGQRRSANTRGGPRQVTAGKPWDQYSRLPLGQRSIYLFN